MDPAKCIYFLAYILILLPLPCLYKTEEWLQCNAKDHLLKAQLKEFSVPKDACRNPVYLEAASLLCPFPETFQALKYAAYCLAK